MVWYVTRHTLPPAIFNMTWTLLTGSTECIDDEPRRVAQECPGQKEKASWHSKSPDMTQEGIRKIASIGITWKCPAHSVAEKNPLQTLHRREFNLTLFSILRSEWETYCICYFISEREGFSLRILRREWFLDNWTPCGVGQVETVHKRLQRNESFKHRTEAFLEVMRRGISLNL